MRRTFLALVIAAAPLLAVADICIYQGERVSGLNKICEYKCATGDKSITIKASEVCPRSIN